MTDYTLRAPDGELHVTGDGAERARLLNAGYQDATSGQPAAAAMSTADTATASADSAPAESKPADAKPDTPSARKPSGDAKTAR